MPKGCYDPAESCSVLRSPSRAKNDQRLSSARNSARDKPPSEKGHSAKELRSRITSAVYLGITKLPVLGDRHTLVLWIVSVRWVTPQTGTPPPGFPRSSSGAPKPLFCTGGD